MFPHEQKPGCCPLSIVNQSRQITDGKRSATAKDVLPQALQGVVGAADMTYLNSVDHDTDHSFDFSGASVAELIQAAKSGVVDAGTVMGELSGRIPDAGDAEARGVITSSLTAISEMLKARVIITHTCDIKGNHLRLWSLNVKKVKAISGPKVTVDGSTMTFSDLGASGGGESRPTKVSIERLTTEQFFDTALYQWSLTAHSLGIMAFEISSVFVYEAGYLLRVKHRENFWTTQEYFIACLDLLDRRVCGPTEILNYDRSVMLENARRYGIHFSDAFNASGSKSGEERKGSKPPWNGEYQSPSSKASPCPYFNKDKPHDNPKHLDASGKCIFRHVCYQWIDNAGPKGKCGSSKHGAKHCDNPHRCEEALE